MARRRLMIRVIKWLLPAVALALLSSLALWPELNHATDAARLAFGQVTGNIGQARLIDARYHALDDRGRPYTVTAAVAQQDGPNRIDLTKPKGDITLTNGTWLMLQAKQGVYLHHSQQLDLSHGVTLYRDDGTTLRTASASVDLQHGAAAGADAVHAEGPFGTLDAQGFTVMDKGAVIQFTGPARVVLNGAQP